MPRHLPVAPPPADSRIELRPRDLASTLVPDVRRGELGDISGELLQVGDIAKAAGKTVRAIHHYEEVGLLRPHARSKGRYRLYDETALARVRWIGKMHDLGMSLSQIQEIVHAWETATSAPGAMARMRALYRQKLEDTRAQIAHLATLERELQASLAYLDTCDTCDPAEIVRACSCCEHHEKDQSQPELVAGLHGGKTVTADGQQEA
ncbi:MAG TPA: MerR family transcriptional regulator [Minicystis sp.]|nr:MerR family transcriptional regulator [Minicystis sp.]